MNEINLPPLPETTSGFMGLDGVTRLFTAEQFRAGQIAAVEKDRAERGGMPDSCDVRKIMLAVVPGFDGMGEEVYAKSNADVEVLSGKMGEELEEWRLGINRFSAAPQPQPVQREPLTDEQIYEIYSRPGFTQFSMLEVARAIEAAHGITNTTDDRL